MNKNCLILLDTNVCIYRTLAYVEPKILNRDELEKVTNKIDTLTNNNLSCSLIILDVIAQELANHEILFWEISRFCTLKLKYRKGDFKVLRIFESAKKSIIKFINKYTLNQEIKHNLGPEEDINKINSFYLNYPDKLKEITDRKLSHLSAQFQRNQKLQERPQNLPEENDRIFLCEAIRINKSNGNEVYIFSNDNDFTKFEEEINNKYKIKILKIEDALDEI